MSRRLPIASTLIVALAVAAMVALGVWQLRRADEKAALLARNERAAGLSAAVPWPRGPKEAERALYRRSEVDCLRVRSLAERAGRAASGAMGWAHVATCDLAQGGQADVALGWSRDPAPVAWAGGRVAGFIGPHGHGVRLVAAPPQAGLEALAPPNPADLPNNHLSYAVQWFLFAATALAIYALALRQRWRSRAS
ncbi:MAG: SURF1 family cytochrome oxidase biogenesis protein [Cypionkella sp.]